MSDAMDRQIELEQQRARMQDLLRNAEAALMISLNKEGELITSYINLNWIERRGMIELLHDSAPRFEPEGVDTSDVDEDDEG